MKIKLLTLAIASLVSVNALAVSIDYRHEMQDTAQAGHKDRLLISHRFANGFGLSSEVKWAQSSADKTPNKPFNEQVSNGTEVVASYVYKFNNVFSIEPGFSLESSSSNNNYRPYLRGRANVTDDLSVALRYRPYFKRNSGSINNTKGDSTMDKGYTLTGNIDYTFLKDYTIGYELEYKKGTSGKTILSDNDDYDITHNVKLSYKWDKNWKPYVEVGNVSGSETTDERQTRYRVGVQYSF
ncbi:oligogalacturonate-specific porin KdgM [Dickeya dadantii]|uniref:oligogalacturonate-specific porin KdgM n=1 Tax=Dickeya dadantii TaxID=204038 RepID=UPI0013726308|nr:oligogalacturonate-specific porin KdgM [Dickeya dadantii]MCL6406785.1 oligogalacturonate-specific porin KdgM [Dickeya dadantii]NAT79213.1 porin [Dickeya dadantii]NPE62462.1 oligogalacturonate-specific porin KdgM [Dickeya dadantii]UAY94533.1 oligogalacturonate-specific porin KdgM [Dickeya dadantii]